MTPDSVFEATVHYKIHAPKAGQWFVGVVLRTTEPHVTMGTPYSTVAITDSEGVLQIRQPFQEVWGKPAFAHPFSLWILLNRNRGTGYSVPVIKLGPFTYDLRHTPN